MECSGQEEGSTRSLCLRGIITYLASAYVSFCPPPFRLSGSRCPRDEGKIWNGAALSQGVVVLEQHGVHRGCLEGLSRHIRITERCRDTSLQSFFTTRDKTRYDPNIPLTSSTFQLTVVNEAHSCSYIHAPPSSFNCMPMTLASSNFRSYFQFSRPTFER